MWLRRSKQGNLGHLEQERNIAPLSKISCNTSRYTNDEVLAQWNLRDEFLSLIGDVRISDIPHSIFPSSVEVKYTHANKRQSSVIFMDI